MVSVAKPDSTSVLIVGAGPAGLAAAISLVEHGCKDIVVVDAVPEGENTSRAFAIHAGTLEALETISCAKELSSRSIHVDRMRMSNRAGNLISIPFAHLAQYTKYPFACMIPQNETEAILGDRAKSLGIRVYRPCRVMGFKPQNNDDGTITAYLEGGETIRTKYIVGADGSKSVVRQIAGIGFSDPDGADHNTASQMVVADVLFEELPDPEWRKGGNVILGPGNMFMLMPFPHQTAFRIGFSVSQSEVGPSGLPQLEFIQPYVDKYGPLSDKKPLRIAKILWSSRFRTHAAVAERVFFRFDGEKVIHESKGVGGSRAGVVCVLVGDAAHIHSPVGGQGMNLGLRDAIALGPVVAEHIRRKEGGAKDVDVDTIIEQYACSRRARALRVIGLAKRMLFMFGESSTLSLKKYLWWLPIESVVVRDWALWVVGRLSFITNKMAYSMSGLEDMRELNIL